MRVCVRVCVWGGEGTSAPSVLHIHVLCLEVVPRHFPCAACCSWPVVRCWSDDGCAKALSRCAGCPLLSTAVGTIGHERTSAWAERDMQTGHEKGHSTRTGSRREASKDAHRPTRTNSFAARAGARAAAGARGHPGHNSSADDAPRGFGTSRQRCVGQVQGDAEGAQDWGGHG